jgi:type I restriction enzyme S subunit
MRAAPVRAKRYPKYNTSGIDWVGEIPEHWETKRLKHLVQRADVKTEADDETQLPYVGLEHLDSWTGRLLPLDSELIPTGISNRFECGDTLFGKLRPYLAKACNIEFSGLCSSELLVFRSKKLEKRFLLYLLLSDGFISTVDASTYGAKMPRASWEFIGSCEVPFPLRSEQCAIADYLDAQTARIDALVEKKRTLIERLKEKRTALISRTVTRGLPPDAARAAGLNPHPKLKPSGIEWLGEIPEHWKMLAYKRLCKRVDVGIAEAAVHAYCDEGVPIIRSTNVKPNRLDTSDVLRIEPWFANRNKSKTLRAGDLVTVRTGYPGTTAVIPGEFDGAQCFTLVISSPKANVSAPFFSTIMNSKSGSAYFEMEGWGTAQTNISVPILQFMPVPVPPLLEQTAIVEYLKGKTEQLYLLICKTESAIERLNEFRTALISAAVTGKLNLEEIDQA